MSSFPPPPSPPPPPPPVQPPAGGTWSTPISALTDPPPPVSTRKSGFPAWAWIVVIVAVLGGGAVALFTLGGDDDKKAASGTTLVGSDDTTGGTNGNEPDSSAPITPPATNTGGGIPTGVTGTHESPVPAGEIADIGGGWRLQVLDVITDAGEQMAAADEFFDPAPAGSTYMLVKVALGYFGTDDPKIGFEPDLAVLGSANIALDNFCLATVPDEADFFNYVFSGGVVVGNTCYIAPVDQAGTFQMFGKGDFFADEGVYLELATPASPVQPMAALFGPQPGADSTEARLAPTPVGTTTEVGPDWQLTVTGAARDITAEIMAENQFNEPPPEGFHFVGVDVTFNYSGVGGASPAQVSIGAVGGDNVQHGGYCGLVPGEIDLYTDLFAGGTATGTLCLVLPDDGSAVALFATADFNGYIWFATS